MNPYRYLHHLRLQLHFIYESSTIFLDTTKSNISFEQYKVYLILVKSNIACFYCSINENRSHYEFYTQKKRGCPLFRNLLLDCKKSF